MKLVIRIFIESNHIGFDAKLYAKLMEALLKACRGKTLIVIFYIDYVK